jgi:hypothetical protein
MNTVPRSGFTVIETMLFLAVSGGLIVAILAVSGIAVSQQRYRDAAIGVESLLQSQYANTSNVLNSRGDRLKCSNNSGTLLIEPGAGARGASECVVLGRYIRFSPSGSETTVTTSSVIGLLGTDEAPVTNDIDALKQYIMIRSSLDEEVASVSWGAQIVKPRTDTPQDITILVLRSPLSGSLRTFIPTGALPSPGSRVIEASAIDALNTEETLCLATKGFSTGQALGITVRAGAGGASAIEMQAEDGPC